MEVGGDQPFIILVPFMKQAFEDVACSVGVWRNKEGIL